MGGSERPLCHLIKRYTLDFETLPPTDLTDTINHLIHHIVVLTVQTTDALGGRASDVEDARGIVAVVDGDFVSVPHWGCRVDELSIGWIRAP